jgi:hypothetical protein
MFVLDLCDDFSWRGRAQLQTDLTAPNCWNETRTPRFQAKCAAIDAGRPLCWYKGLKTRNEKKPAPAACRKGPKTFIQERRGSLFNISGPKYPMKLDRMLSSLVGHKLFRGAAANTRLLTRTHGSYPNQRRCGIDNSSAIMSVLSIFVSCYPWVDLLMYLLLNRLIKWEAPCQTRSKRYLQSITSKTGASIRRLTIGMSK